MKKLITNRELPQEIELERLIGRELIAYRTKNTVQEGSICVLSKLHDQCRVDQFGFINISYSNTAPVFLADTWIDAIKKAANSRQLYVFNNLFELILALHENKF